MEQNISAFKESFSKDAEIFFGSGSMTRIVPLSGLLIIGFPTLNRLQKGIIVKLPTQAVRSSLSQVVSVKSISHLIKYFKLISIRLNNIKDLSIFFPANWHNLDGCFSRSRMAAAFFL